MMSRRVHNDSNDSQDEETQKMSNDVHNNNNRSFFGKYGKFYDNFTPPPPGPVFEPTEEEFKDPLTLIASIKEKAERYGVVKIKPPPSWHPPFSLDQEKFQFTPRVQKLNTLEGFFRIRQSFFNKIAVFWHLQGLQTQMPRIEKINWEWDLYEFHKIVAEEGGYQSCTDNRNWPEVASRMNLDDGFAQQLMKIYKTILLPYDLLLDGSVMKHIQEEKTETAPKPKLKKRRRSACWNLRPKPSATKIRRKTTEAAPVPSDSHNSEIDEDAKNIVCQKCRLGDNEAELLLCDTESCDNSFHIKCLLPRIDSVDKIKGKWHCPECILEKMRNPAEFGFKQSRHTFNLEDFQQHAEKIKNEIFGDREVVFEELEREYWRRVFDLKKPTSVLYGADLTTEDLGSGFPLPGRNYNSPEERSYSRSPWNLNNLPTLKNSILTHIDEQDKISGMMVPWLYVGMCFATFCWHTEDHWSYSINYLHWGDAKRWYGVSGLEWEKFERVVKELIPDAFHDHPDLLHHIVTTINPAILMEMGVKVYTILQEAGEFVITFPRAFHGGFNVGSNFAEAVNFCPADWISIGRESIAHYALSKRRCVFSHDELICRIAESTRNKSVLLCGELLKDLETMVKTEKYQRQRLLELEDKVKNKCPVGNTIRTQFENLSDESRICVHCKTTLFNSALGCSCQPDKFVCLQHVSKLCDTCPRNKWTLYYRYAMEEFIPMMRDLKERMITFNSWGAEVQEALGHQGPERLDLADLRNLLDIAKSKDYPYCHPLTALQRAVMAADRWGRLVRQMLTEEKVKTRGKTQGNQRYKLTFEAILKMRREADGLVCKMEEAEELESFIGKVEDYRAQVASLLENFFDHSPDEWLPQLQEMFNKGVSFDIQLDEIDYIKRNLDRCSWLCKTDKIVSRVETLLAKKSEESGDEDESSDVTPSDDLQAAPDTKQLITLLAEGLNFSNSQHIASRREKLNTLIDAMNQEASQNSKKQGRAAAGNSADYRCQADDCTGDYERWIQCEGECLSWFHEHCVNLTPAQVEVMKINDEQYICRRCQQLSSLEH